MTVYHNEKKPLLPLAGKLCFIIFSIGILLLSHDKISRSDDSILWMVLILLFIFFINYLIWTLELHLRISTFDVRFKYPPFINNWKVIPKEHLQGYSIERYNWAKFGGWGLGYNVFNGGWAYTTFHKYVLVLCRNEREPLRIGTFEMEAVDLAMKKMMKRRDG